MNNINTIINLEDHPIENKEYRNYCFENLFSLFAKFYTLLSAQFKQSLTLFF